MSVSTTPRLGVTQWSAGTDPYNRSQLNSSLAAIEGKAAGFLQGTVRPAAAPANQGFFFFNTTGNAISYSDGATWWDLVAGDGNFGSPVALTITSTASDGVQSTAARSDHRHAMPGFGTPVSIGTSNGAGSGDLVARATHVHSIGVGAINDSAMFAPGILGSASLEDLSVTTNKLAELAVTTSKIANGAVGNTKLAVDAVQTSNILDGNVTNAKLASGIDAAKVTTGVFADARIPSFAASKITSGTFDDARIPGIPASKIDSGTLAIARIPTGTSSSTVALGNHNHSGVYATASHNHSGVYLPDTGGTISGSLTITGSLGVGSDMSNTGAPGTTNSGLASWRVGTNKAFWAFTSSASYKTDIEDAPADLVDKVLQLQPRQFRSKHAVDEGKTLYGLIAEEVHQILPEYTSGYDEKTGRVESISLDGLVVPMLAALKKLSRDYEDLKAELSTMRNRDER